MKSNSLSHGQWILNELEEDEQVALLLIPLWFCTMRLIDLFAVLHPNQYVMLLFSSKPLRNNIDGTVTDREDMTPDPCCDWLWFPSFVFDIYLIFDMYLIYI